VFIILEDADVAKTVEWAVVGGWICESKLYL
jgi:hypothetical protein